MSTNFPYDCFLTEKVISLKDLEISPINFITDATKTTTYSTKTHISLFSDKKYKDLIDTFIKNNKLNTSIKNNNNKNIEDLSKIFLDLNQSINKKDYLKEIYEFCKYFYNMKYLFIKEKQNYLKFSSLLRQLNINKNLFSKNLRYSNPIIYDGDLNQNIKLNELLSSHDNEERTAIDNVILGEKINFSLPSIGPIYSIYTLHSHKCDISTLIYRLITIDRPNYVSVHSYLNDIPLFRQNVYDTLANILYEKNNKNNLWDFKVGNSNNKKLDYLKQYFKNADVSLTEIFYDSNNTIKTKYQIPYKTENPKSNNIIYTTTPEKIGLGLAPTEENEVKYWNIQGLILSNNTLIKILIPLIDANPDYLNKPNVKNVLCCYVFFMINLFYDFYKAYIDKLNNIVINISSSKQYIDLNFSGAFNYIERLNLSLLNFKIMLLNNFYELFLPSSIVKYNYGMMLNNLGFYIPEGPLLANNIDIKNNFPFKQEILCANHHNNKQTLVSFMFLNKSITDIYDSNLSLDLGGFSYNKITTKNTISLLNKFFNNYKVKNLFNIYLLELLEKFFKEKSCVEFIESLKEFLINNPPTNIIKYENYLEEYYKKNLFSASVYMVEIIKINKKLKSIKSNSNNEEYKKKDVYLLTSNILYYNSEICKYIVKYDSSLSNDLKRQLLEKYTFYNKKATDKILELHKNYKENKMINNSINKPENITLNVSFWKSFKRKISNKKLLIPIFIAKKSEIIFIDILEYAINGNYSNDLIFTIPKDITQDYIINELMRNCIILFGKSIKDIKQNKFIAIKSELIDKIKLLNDDELVRKNIFKLFTDIIFYNKYSIAISTSLEFYNLFKIFIKNKSNNFNRLIISHTQIKKITESV